MWPMADCLTVAELPVRLAEDADCCSYHVAVYVMPAPAVA